MKLCKAFQFCEQFHDKHCPELSSTTFFLSTSQPVDEIVKVKKKKKKIK